MFQRTEQHILMTQLNINKRVKGVLPSRAEQLEKLKCQEFDVLVIGGGATGSGVSRGKSNKMAHIALTWFYFFYVYSVRWTLRREASKLPW